MKRPWTKEQTSADLWGESEIERGDCASEWQLSLSKPDPSPHSVTLGGIAGYFERLVAQCC